MLFLASVFLWQRPVQVAHVKDMHFFVYYTQRAQYFEPPNGDPNGTDYCFKWKLTRILWFVGHLVFTVLFMFLSWYLISLQSA